MSNHSGTLCIKGLKIRKLLQYIFELNKAKLEENARYLIICTSYWSEFNLICIAPISLPKVFSLTLLTDILNTLIGTFKNLAKMLIIKWCYGISRKVDCVSLSDVSWTKNEGPTLRSEIISCNCKPLENDEKWFLFHLKNLFFFSRYFNLCPSFFGHVGKRLDEKAKVNFKIYDAIDWEINIYNTHIAQSDNEIWSVSRV